MFAKQAINFGAIPQVGIVKGCNEIFFKQSLYPCFNLSYFMFYEYQREFLSQQICILITNFYFQQNSALYLLITTQNNYYHIPIRCCFLRTIIHSATPETDVISTMSQRKILLLSPVCGTPERVAVVVPVLLFCVVIVNVISA